MSARVSLVLLFLAPFIAAPSASSLAQPRTTRGTASLDADGRVRVDTHEGRISIDTWDREEVRYEAVVRPEEDAEHPEATTVQVDRSDRRLVLTTEHEDSDGDSGGVFGGLFGIGSSQNIMPVEYTLTVPRTARVEIDDHESTIQVQDLAAELTIDTHDGPITVSGQSGEAELDSHDGDITVENQTGSLEIDVHDSEVRLRAVEGETEIDAHEGDLTIEDLRGPLTVDTHDGNGQIDVAALTGALEIETHDGAFTISLPSGAGFDLATDFDDDATLTAGFDLAPYRVSFGDDDDEANYEGSINGGGPRVRLTADDGSFDLRMR